MSKKAKKRSNSLKIPTIIIYTAKFLQSISPKLLTKFAARLFTTPMRHKMPKREFEMERKSKQAKLFVPSIGKEIVTYEFGDAAKKVLLVHGWSGRGTQLVKIAERLTEEGYSTVSFDAPAHGKSDGKTTLMPEFIASILEIEKHFGPFEGAVGHSLGGMSLLNAVKRGLKIDRLVIIGSGDKISDILTEFVDRMRLKHKLVDDLRTHFEANFNKETMESFSAYIAAKEVEIPVLVIHDNDDAEVPVKCAIHIQKHLKNGELLLTKGLGHRKILGDPEVIERTIDFIEKQAI
ncbi:alpha/beta hydrolase [Flavobacterium sp. MAH-1]|uniref:Alpha/beta hydrolase n=1 Tax=Flavobacterium agri TaxID=2743471 RepID=A0A7Y8Y028_9FLAO|nr:alpha/beta hydrolase [Flavobacterium agri]NUY80052.1 alpha/beta hydrolase [Flavobacterium agri]NYA70077.1 alpha/beta hydrolase [Flavobacterium agri]